MTRQQAEKTVEREQPETPAKVTQLHVQDRTFRNDAGQIVAGQQAWRRLSPLEACYAKGQLAGGCDRYTAQARFDAGQRYSEIFLTAQSSGRDSTQALNVSRSGGGLPLSQAQSDAIRSLVAIDSCMGERDRRIVRLVCGEGHWPSEAIRTVCADYKHTIAARFREALDSLVEAHEMARRGAAVKFNLGRTA